MIDPPLIALMSIFSRAMRSGRYEEAVRVLRQCGLSEEQAWTFLRQSLPR